MAWYNANINTQLSCEGVFMKRFSVFINTRVFTLAVALVFGLALVGCETDINDDPKSLIITGVSGSDVPAEYSHIEIDIWFMPHNVGHLVAGQERAQINNQTIQAPLFVYDLDFGWTSEAWTGYGNYLIFLRFINSDRSTAAYFDYTGDASKKNVAHYFFSKPESVIEFSKFVRNSNS